MIAHSATDPFGETEECRLDLRRIERVLVERMRMPDRLRNVLARDLAFVDPVRTVRDIGAVLAEPRFEDRAIERGELPDRPETPGGEHLPGFRSDAPEPLER